MAAPVALARSTPGGTKLPDGFSTLITFTADPDVSLYESTVTPPGVDGGDAVGQTTMHNSVWRTFSPRELKTLTDSTFTAGYDPAVYSQIVSLCNVATTITVTFPDGSSLAFFGFLRTFEPSANAEGTMPEATVTITPTNMDDDGVEQAPVYSASVGT